MAQAPQRDPVEERLLTRFGRTFHSGELVFAEGSDADEAYVIHEGRIRLVKRFGTAERSLRVLGPGDLFGETALAPKGVRGQTAVALTTGLMLALDTGSFQHVLAQYPSLGSRLLHQLLERLQRAEAQVELLMIRGAQSKVVLALLKLAQSGPAAPGAPCKGVELSVSPMELATLVGLDVDSVKRTVQRLRDSGHLKILGERVSIDDLEALRELHHVLGARDQLAGQPIAPHPRSSARPPD